MAVDHSPPPPVTSNLHAQATRPPRAGPATSAASSPGPRPRAEPPVAAVQAHARRRPRGAGDEALRDLTERFDGVRRPSRCGSRRPSSTRRWPPSPRCCARRSRRPGPTSSPTTASSCTRRRDHERDGLVVRELRRPVDRAGVYVPGGLAPLISTVLMTVIPARVAGVPEVVLCSPPDRETGTVAAGITGRRRARRRRRGVRRRRAAGHRGHGLRHRVDPPRRRDRRPRQRLRGHGQAGGRRHRRRPVERSPGPPRWSSWPTRRPRPSTPPSTSSCRPSTDPTAWPG